MFSDPLVINGSANVTMALNNIDAAKSTRSSTDSDSPYARNTLQIGSIDSRENPKAGGSVRHLVRFDRQVFSPTSGELLGTASAQLVIVVPNISVSGREAASLCAQWLVSFLLGESDGTLSTDATVDATVIGKLLNREP